MTKSHSFQGKKNFEEEKLNFFTKNIEDNSSYKNLAKSKSLEEQNKLIRRFELYRKKWNSIQKELENKDKLHEILPSFPLCVDIEVAAICDLACPFCYRQSIITPDKLISDSLYENLIKQCEALGVPSLKLNWRGEPLLHPKIDKYIKLAKKSGILEVIINTNATKLTEDLSKKIILSGLDTIIFSFDGGTKETYNEMRPGRFEENSFDSVYQNIKKFDEIKKSMNAKFPRSKIQMILTKKTGEETKNFFKLFEHIVDDVSIKTYTERGGYVEEIDNVSKSKISQSKNKLLNPKTIYSKDYKDNVYYSNSRKPCAQPFQRLMVTYDGKVSMCCYDWGSMHPIGYVDEQGFLDSDKDLAKVEDNIKKNKKGFKKIFDKATRAPLFNNPEKKISTLKELWDGNEINKVRKLHLDDKIDEVTICKKCPFKDTYDWQPL